MHPPAVLADGIRQVQQVGGAELRQMAVLTAFAASPTPPTSGDAATPALAVTNKAVVGGTGTADQVGGPDSAPTLGSLTLVATSSSAPATVTATAGVVTGASPITAYLWDFGDGSDTQGSPGPRDQHTFEYGGTYAITLVALDRAGDEATASATVQLTGPPAPSAAPVSESQLTGSAYCSAPAVSLSTWGEQEYVALNGGGSVLHSPNAADTVSIDGVYACGPLPDQPTSVTTSTAYGFQCSELVARYYMVEQATGAIPTGNGHGIAYNIAAQSGLALVPAPAEASGAAPPVGVAPANVDWVTSSSNPAGVLPEVGDIISMGASQAMLDAYPDDAAELSLGHTGVVISVTPPDPQTQTDGSVIIAQQDSDSSPNPGLGQIRISWQGDGLSDGAYDEFNWVSMGYAPSAVATALPIPSTPSPAAASGDGAPSGAPTPLPVVVRHLAQLAAR